MTNLCKISSCLVLFLGLAAPTLAQIDITVQPSPAPDRTRLAAHPAYAVWAASALDSLQTDGLNRGDRNSDPGGYVVLERYVPSDILTTDFKSWRGVVNPPAPYADQHGSRMHWGVHIRGDGVTTFTIVDVSYQIWSSDRNDDYPMGTFGGLGNFVHGSFATADWNIDCTHGFGYDWGADRAKGGGDDTLVCGAGQENTPVDELFYVGPGNSLYATQAGNQDFLDAGGTLQQVVDTRLTWSNGRIFEIGADYSVLGSDSQTYSQTSSLILDCNTEPGGTPCPTPVSDLDTNFERPAHLGGSATILRSSNVLELYAVDRNSEGTRALRITQDQINAATEAGCLLASSDGRFAVTLTTEGNVIASEGPDFERKIHHVIFGGGLNGSVIGTHTTYSDDPPGINCPGYVPAGP